MGNILIILVLLVLTIIGFVFGKSASKQKTEAEYNRIYAQCIADGKLQRAEIKELLAALPITLDREFNPGAMCYEMVSIAAPKARRIDYICPVCMQRTAYPSEWQVLKELDEYRRLAKQIQGIDAELDERQFCRKCSPDVKNPQLILRIKLDGDSRVHNAVNFSITDLHRLVAFLKGNVVYDDERQKNVLLFIYSTQVREILGLEYR